MGFGICFEFLPNASAAYDLLNITTVQLKPIEYQLVTIIISNISMVKLRK